MALALHCFTMHREEQLTRLLMRTHGMFDITRVCGGTMHDHTDKICAAFGADYSFNPWKDCTSAQLNFLLQFSAADEGILCCDDDEVPSGKLIVQLREWMADYERDKKPFIGKIPFLGVTDEEIVFGDPANPFLSERFFINDGQVKFEGITHWQLERELVKGWGIKEAKDVVHHHKSQVSFIKGDVRSGFINPEQQGIPAETGKELRHILHANHVTDVWSLYAFLEDGHIPENLVEILRTNTENPALRSWFWWYFCVLHPEEMAANGIGLDHPAVEMYYRHLVAPYRNNLEKATRKPAPEPPVPRASRSWMTDDEVALLEKYAEASEGDVVECGTFRSGTAEAMARKTENTVWSIDMYADNELKEFDDYDPVFSYQTYLAELDNVFLVVGDAIKLGRAWKPSIYMAVLDAAHSYEDTLAIFGVWKNHVTDPGYIAIHDYGDNEPGIMKFVDKLLAEGYWRVVERVDTLIILERNT